MPETVNLPRASYPLVNGKGSGIRAQACLPSDPPTTQKASRSETRKGQFCSFLCYLIKHILFKGLIKIFEEVGKHNTLMVKCASIAETFKCDFFIIEEMVLCSWRCARCRLTGWPCLWDVWPVPSPAGGTYLFPTPFPVTTTSQQKGPVVTVQIAIIPGVAMVERRYWLMYLAHKITSRVNSYCLNFPNMYQ